MHVEMRALATIKPYPHNPRHNDQAVDAVAASLREFGFRQPIVMDEDGASTAGGKGRRINSLARPTPPMSGP